MYGIPEVQVSGLVDVVFSEENGKIFLSKMQKEPRVEVDLKDIE